ncbi:RNA polymerase sigma factor ShbA [Amycolatopsis acidiphila]|uniref:Sigma-70 family RNA polymerase sigma factor n=1 Tax=Amycolatopsis acidiphila TaxID=715473 RepID=A0A558AHC6_9PSEU|nr:RNA polymerase sigma factor ShbA [Amycolatopsis acidiphila]TVT23621.1 sigma-70 family RNA polymerase sigma factor [Amycolatopsis acidiphila]UIJ58607.1 RNA polymerase sigma factor ShbA [Amycolatopsis acidiphila]GHG76517.1 RNA polymerase sigma factor SigD [Amycolatopsis acidiphila]
MKTDVPPVSTVPAEAAVPGFTTPQSFPRGPASRLTKEELDPAVKEAATGDPAAIARLIGMITPVAVRYCRARLGGRDLSYLSADDVAQEVCLAVLHALPNYQDRGGSFLYLVHAIASNKVADAYRLVSRDRSDPVAELPERPLTDNEPEKRVLDVDLGARLNKLVSTLPPLQQEILTLRLIVGLSANETAEALGISAGNVRVTQHRALTKLRAMVTRDGDLVED